MQLCIIDKVGMEKERYMNPKGLISYLSLNDQEIITNFTGLFQSLPRKRFQRNLKMNSYLQRLVLFVIYSISMGIL